MNVIRSAAKKPVLTASLVLDMLSTVAALVLGLVLLISLPAPVPQTYAKIVREQVESIWWIFLTGGLLLILYRLLYSMSLLLPESSLPGPLVTVKRLVITEYMSRVCALEPSKKEEVGKSAQPAAKLESLTSNVQTK